MSFIDPENIAKEIHGEDKYINNAEMEWMLTQYNELKDQKIDMNTFRDYMEQNGE